MTNGVKNHGIQLRGAYEEAVMGFREYWYPVCMSGDITETPKAFTLLGDPVVMVRRDGEIYALKDECPHRGTQLSMINTRKNLEFPGTPTITCAYHGWTYDVRDGKCVAVISEGPDSPVPAAGIRAKTYPIEVRRGMVWIWMGSSKPVPVEEDIPNLLLDPKNVVKAFARVKYGNWRFHVENVAAGHAQMVHKSTLQNWFGPERGTPALPVAPHLASYSEDMDGKGIDNHSPPPTPGLRPYPGLGVWHGKTRWQRLLFGWVPPRKLYPGAPVAGAGDIRTLKLMLPGVVRVPNSPIPNYMYYEWYIPVDELHYIYMQVMAYWPKGLLDRIISEVKYYFYHRPTRPVLFNNQDASMVAATTKFFVNTGSIRYLTTVSPNDQIDIAWREYCDEFARGVGTAYQKPSSRPASQTDSKQEPAVEAEEGTLVAGGAGD